MSCTPMNPRLLIVSAALLLAACDIPGLGPDPRIAQREAEGKAIGGGCRYAMRGIEECYRLYPKSPKTAIFDGWREMDIYMRENKLEGQPPPPEPRENDGSADAKESTAAKVQADSKKTDTKASASDKKAR